MTSYNILLEKVNSEFSFSDFYFNIFEKHSRDEGFEFDGNIYYFGNPHENKGIKQPKILPVIGNSNQKLELSVVNESISNSPNNM